MSRFVCVTKTPKVPVGAPGSLGGSALMFQPVRSEAVSVTLKTPRLPPTPSTTISRKLAGTPTPPWPEIAAGSPLRNGAPVLSPAVIVMLRPTTSAPPTFALLIVTIAS